MFMSRISNGWELAKASWGVLKLDKELLLFPLMSGIACLVVLASFALPLWNSDYMSAISESSEGGVREIARDPIGYVILFAFYFSNYFVIIFFNSALISCAVIRFSGRNPTLGDGLRMASARLPQILGWALVAATVGLILRIIEDRSEKVGRIIAGLLGMAWSVLTYFVVPVMVVEKAGPVDAFKRSASILRKTWGEALIGNFSISLIVFLLGLIGIVPILLAFVIGSTAVAVFLIAVAIVYWILLSLASAALNGILIAALYQYAVTDQIPEGFDADQLSSVFVRR